MSSRVRVHQACRDTVGTSEAALVIFLKRRLAPINSAQGPGALFVGFSEPIGMASTTSSKSDP